MMAVSRDSSWRRGSLAAVMLAVLASGCVRDTPFETPASSPGGGSELTPSFAINCGGPGCAGGDLTEDTIFVTTLPHPQGERLGTDPVALPNIPEKTLLKFSASGTWTAVYAASGYPVGTFGPHGIYISWGCQAAVRFVYGPWYNPPSCTTIGSSAPPSAEWVGQVSGAGTVRRLDYAGLRVDEPGEGQEVVITRFDAPIRILRTDSVATPPIGQGNVVVRVEPMPNATPGGQVLPFKILAWSWEPAVPNLPGATTIPCGSGTLIPFGWTSCSFLAKEAGRLTVRATVNGGEEQSAHLDIEIAEAVNLTCTPDQIVRGSMNIACNASAPAGTSQFAVTSWSFTGQDIAPDSVVHADTVKSWVGKLVTSGQVRVRAVVDGVPVTRTDSVTALPRNWSGLGVPHTSVLDSGGIMVLPPIPIELGHLGRHKGFGWIPLLPEHFQVPVSGPNQGVHYLLVPSFTAESHININYPAMSPGSVWFNKQPPTGSSGCTQAEIASFLTVVEAHEGLSPSPASLTSHAGVLRDTASALIPVAQEGAVGLGINRLMNRLDALTEPAWSHVEAVARDSIKGGTVPAAPWPCTWIF